MHCSIYYFTVTWALKCGISLAWISVDCIIKIVALTAPIYLKESKTSTLEVYTGAKYEVKKKANAQVREFLKISWKQKVLCESYNPYPPWRTATFPGIRAFKTADAVRNLDNKYMLSASLLGRSRKCLCDQEKVISSPKPNFKKKQWAWIFIAINLV